LLAPATTRIAPQLAAHPDMTDPMTWLIPITQPLSMVDA
jgi:hypothetical protein